MSLTTSERKVTLDHKITPAEDFKAFEVGDEGIVEAIVSVTNIKDDVDDIIQPGAYAKTLAMRKPKGVFGHDWSIPVAKTLAIEEWMPGDSRLPARLQAVNAGGLYVKAQFNLKTQRGRDAFEDVKFFGPESEFSIGYAVPAGGATVDPKTGIRLIKELELFEYSPVLFGAAPMTEALSVKRSGSKAALEEKPYHIEKDGDNYVVVESNTGKPVPGGSHSTREAAAAHLRALYANVPDAAKADDTMTHDFEGDEDSVCLTCGLPESASIHDGEEEDDEKSLATCAEHFVASTHNQKTVQHCGLPLGHIGSHALLTTEESEMAKKDAAPKEVETPGGEVPVEVASNETTSATTEQLSGDLQEALARDAETSGGGEAKDDGAEKAVTVETEVKETVPGEGADDAPEKKPENGDETETTGDAPEETEAKVETEVPEVETSETSSTTIKEKLQRLDAMIDDLLGQLSEEDELTEVGKDAQNEVTPKLSVEVSHGSYEKVSAALSEIRESLFTTSDGVKTASWTEETVPGEVTFGVATYTEGEEDEWGHPEIVISDVKYSVYHYAVEDGKVSISTPTEGVAADVLMDVKVNPFLSERYFPEASEKVVSAVEAKEGRTLSAANAEKIRKAVQSLVDVLSQAGIEVEGSDDEKTVGDSEGKTVENADSAKEAAESGDNESKTDEKSEPSMVTLSPKELMDLQLQALKASL